MVGLVAAGILIDAIGWLVSKHRGSSAPFWVRPVVQHAPGQVRTRAPTLVATAKTAFFAVAPTTYATH
jgi:hypothetical protein